MMMLSILVVVLIFWVGLLSYFLWKTQQHYRKLIVRTRSNSIDEVLDMLLKDMQENKADTNDIRQALIKMEKESNSYLNKIGFVKFSPFERIGGEQSFVIALLNKLNSGLVFNFLYTRDGVRIYAKPVKDGMGTEFELSNEELEAIYSSKSE